MAVVSAAAQKGEEQRPIRPWVVELQSPWLAGIQHFAVAALSVFGLPGSERARAVPLPLYCLIRKLGEVIVAQSLSTFAALRFWVLDGKL